MKPWPSSREGQQSSRASELILRDCIAENLKKLPKAERRAARFAIGKGRRMGLSRGGRGAYADYVWTRSLLGGVVTGDVTNILQQLRRFVLSRWTVDRIFLL
jgi:hypothetical protein